MGIAGAGARPQHVRSINPARLFMAPPINPETAKTLRDTVVSVDTTGKLFAKLQPRYKKMSTGLKAAIAQGSLPKIELYQPELEEVIGEIDNCMKAAKASLALIGFLRGDKEFLEAKFDQIEQLTNKVADIQTTLTAYRKEAADLDKQASSAHDKLEGGNDDLLGELSEMKDTYNDIEKATDYIEKEAAKLEAQTRKAQAAGNAKEMSAARVRFLDLGYSAQEIGAVALQGKLTRFKNKVKDRDQLRELQDMIDGLPGLIDRLRTLSKTGRELVLLKVDKPEPKEAKANAEPATLSNADLAKCVKTLGFDPKNQSKLAKVLNGPRDKWAAELTKLAKALEMDDTDGKAMVVKLNKLDFIKKQYLIDI
jgi:chromosome segregation ATPase